MIIKQLLIGSWDVFCYIIGCEKTKEAAIIDPAGDVDRILKESSKAKLSIKYIFNTHRHADHTAGNKKLKKKTGAPLIIHSLDADDYPYADMRLNKKTTSMMVGQLAIQVIHTPGHSPGGICLYTEGQLFTGDTLFVGDSGRSDLPGGHRPTLGASLRELMKLPEDTVVWPGHNYGPTKSSTIGWEKRHNVNAKEYGFLRKN